MCLAIGSSFLILQTVSIRFKASSPSINESASAIANERDINEGMKVVIDGDGRLQKAEDRS